MDKFFVYFALAIFYLEGRIALWESLAMISRDFSVLLYGLSMATLGRWKNIEFKAIRWGKVVTSLQFIVLIGLTFTASFSWIVFAGFIIMGLLAFAELLQLSNPFSSPQKAA
jgi:CDP-diacylglycerol--glycerol-3-phosphate 3-phosphatidyltransferase